MNYKEQTYKVQEFFDSKGRKVGYPGRQVNDEFVLQTTRVWERTSYGAGVGMSPAFTADELRFIADKLDELNERHISGTSTTRECG